MRLLKIIKVKIIVLALGLSSFCLSEDLKHNKYNDLLIAVQQCNFNKFEKLYSVNNLSDFQKNELMKSVQAIIETEKSNLIKSNFYKVGLMGNIHQAELRIIKGIIKVLSGLWIVT